MFNKAKKSFFTPTAMKRSPKAELIFAELCTLALVQPLVATAAESTVLPEPEQPQQNHTEKDTQSAVEISRTLTQPESIPTVEFAPDQTEDQHINDVNNVPDNPATRIQSQTPDELGNFKQQAIASKKNAVAKRSPQDIADLKRQLEPSFTETLPTLEPLKLEFITALEAQKALKVQPVASAKPIVETAIASSEKLDSQLPAPAGQKPPTRTVTAEAEIRSQEEIQETIIKQKSMPLFDHNRELVYTPQPSIRLTTTPRNLAQETTLPEQQSFDVAEQKTQHFSVEKKRQRERPFRVSDELAVTNQNSSENSGIFFSQKRQNQTGSPEEFAPISANNQTLINDTTKLADILQHHYSTQQLSLLPIEGYNPQRRKFSEIFRKDLQSPTKRRRQ